MRAFSAFPSAVALIALNTRQWLLLTLVATVTFRVWFSAVAPMTPDEAYFILWGRSPSLGYYDHPPMVGWMLAPLAAFSEAAWLMRLPTVLVAPLMALAVWAALRRWFGRDEDSANLAALIVLLVPMNILNVFVTTDTPLVLFSVASLLIFARAAQQDSARLFLCSGALLGLAFLSKYFAVLLGLAFLLWAVLSKKPRSFVFVFLGALPFGLLNLYWNLNACWCNIMFNAINRHAEGDSGWSVSNPALYAASLAYLAAPLLWFAWRGRARLRETWAQPSARALLLAWLVPLVVFAALSAVKTIGLHWLFSFVPALVLSVALALERQQLVLSARFFAAFAALHMVLITTVLALPLETWKESRIYSRPAFPGRVAELMTAVAPDLAGRELATDSYASAALLAYYTRRPVPNFGIGTAHARQSDIDTDWRAYDGKDLLILRGSKPPLQDYQPYFREIEIKEIPLGGGVYHAILGRGFDYGTYRAHYLTDIRNRYYRIPAALPVVRCYFFERYFPR